jgi:putative oxidoreductase
MSVALRFLHWACRIVLAGIFLYSGYIKLQSPLQFAAAIAGYKLVPNSFIMPLADYLPWVEMALGVLLLSGWKIRYAAIGASVLLLAFIAILTITYIRGIDANCGCFGFGDKISPRTIARDGLILLPAVFLAAEALLRKSATNYTNRTK